MINCHSLLLFILIFTSKINAQNLGAVVPYDIDLGRKEQPVIVYFGANNWFEWKKLKTTDSLGMQSNSLFKCIRKDSTHFEIQSSPYQDSLPLDESYITIYLVRNSNPIDSMTLLVKLFPEVEVEIFLDEKKINDTFEPDSLYRAKQIRSHARLLYPSYVKSFNRFRGVHEVKIYHDQTQIGFLTGWNDTGDSSRLTAIPEMEDEMRVVVEEHSLNSLAFIKSIRNGKKTPLKLSSSTPREFRLMNE